MPLPLLPPFTVPLPLLPPPVQEYLRALGEEGSAQAAAADSAPAAAEAAAEVVSRWAMCRGRLRGWWRTAENSRHPSLHAVDWAPRPTAPQQLTSIPAALPRFPHPTAPQKAEDGAEAKSAKKEKKEKKEKSSAKKEKKEKRKSSEDGEDAAEEGKKVGGGTEVERRWCVLWGLEGHCAMRQCGGGGALLPGVHLFTRTQCLTSAAEKEEEEGGGRFGLMWLGSRWMQQARPLRLAFLQTGIKQHG